MFNELNQAKIGGGLCQEPDPEQMLQSTKKQLEVIYNDIEHLRQINTHPEHHDSYLAFMSFKGQLHIEAERLASMIESILKDIDKDAAQE